MAWTGISNTVPQYEENGIAASGFYIKFYASGTVTPIPMAIDSTGVTTLAKCLLSTEGYPLNGSSAEFIPHIDQLYKIVLYRNATDADADTTANAAWVVDALSPVLTDNSIFVDSYQAVRDLTSSDSTIYVRGTAIAGDGGESFFQKKTGSPAGTYVDDDDNVIVPTGGDGSTGWVKASIDATLLTAGIFTSNLSNSVIVNTRGYSANGDGGAARWIATGVTTLGSAGTLAKSTAKIYDVIGTEFLLDYDQTLNVNKFGMFADTVVDGSIVTDYSADWLAIVDTLRPSRIYLPKKNGFSYRMEVFKIKADSEVFGDGSSLTLGTVVEVFNDTATVVMGQINSDTNIHSLQIKSIETDLALQRTTTEGASRITLSKMVFDGFRDVTPPTDAWGLYIRNSENVSVYQCGFDHNTQSDIAIVGNTKNITLDGCYGLGSTFHVNFEPNTSNEFNENITLKNMHMSKLSMLENGSGGTANRAINISGCEVDVFQYDGAQVTLQDCQVASWSVESEPFFGELKLINSVALGPNLLEDPYMVNIGLNSTAAAADNNSWYMNSRTGAIAGDQLDPLIEDGIRFIRINPTNASGTINFRPLNPISSTSGEHYLVAVTGKRKSGTDAVFMQISDGSADLNCRIFRQSNEGENHWTTEMIVIPAATGNFFPKVGLYSTSTSSVDIHAITVHKILGIGGGEDAILNQFHGNIYGPRELLPVNTLPTFSDANVRGVIAGDRISIGSTGVLNYWSGSAWVAM